LEFADHDGNSSRPAAVEFLVDATYSTPFPFAMSSSTLLAQVIAQISAPRIKIFLSHVLHMILRCSLLCAAMPTIDAKACFLFSAETSQIDHETIFEKLEHWKVQSTDEKGLHSLFILQSTSKWIQQLSQ
jgi:hypothetical protein